jgi:sporulation protein YlmC with PRC-barrel domain
MRVDLDAKVRTSDGREAGSVQRAVVDPRRNEVTDFVVSTGGLLGYDVLVPRAEIERASDDGDALRLRLTKEELERLPAYAPAAYAPPASGWVPPVGYGFPYGGYLWPLGTGAGLPPATTLPASDPGAAAGASGFGSSPGEADGDLPEISKGAVVLDRNGEDVGTVEDVRLDAASGRLRGFVLRVGGTLRTLFGGGDVVDVDVAEVERVEAETVRLRINKDALERASR